MKTNKYQGLTITSCNHTQLARIYGVSWKTMQRWLKPHLELIGPRQGHIYNGRQIKIIVRLIGPPKLYL